MRLCLTGIGKGKRNGPVKVAVTTGRKRFENA
jgi:hypothetical protein